MSKRAKDTDEEWRRFYPRARRRRQPWGASCPVTPAVLEAVVRGAVVCEYTSPAAVAGGHGLDPAVARELLEYLADHQVISDGEVTPTGGRAVFVPRKHVAEVLKTLLSSRSRAA